MYKRAPREELALGVSEAAFSYTLRKEIIEFMQELL